MNISVISVGTIKEKYLQELIADYEKRISKYANIELISLKDESNQVDEEVVKIIEGKRILDAIKPNSYVILLAIKAELLDSVSFSKKIESIATYYSGKITFVIGGSYGVSKEVEEKADYLLSFSKMTFPHQLMRGILLEQIYRAFKIINNETYHK